MDSRQDPNTTSPLASSPTKISSSPQAPGSRPAIVLLGFILAFLVPLAGLVVSIIARQKVSKESLSGKGLATAGVVISSALLFVGFLFVGLTLWVFGGLGLFHGNDAESASKQLNAQIERIGGKKICSNGDNGHGIDNTIPWYESYYEVPDTPQLTDKVKNIAASQGYQLHINTQAINQLKESSEFALPTDEKYSPQIDYLTGTKDGNSLTVQINRQTAVSLRCGNAGDYGRKQRTNNGTAIMDISLSLPGAHQ